MGLANRVGLAAIDEQLQRESGRITVVARLEEPTLDSTATRETNVGQLQRNADRAQAAVESFVAGREGISIENSFWITNAVVLSVDTGRVPLREVGRIRGVERLHANHEFEPIDEPSESAGGASGSTTTETPSADGSPGGTLEATSVQTTYGVDMVNVPDVWSSYGTKGGGVTVAALDTGIDPDHPDIDLHTTDPSDPTYPGGWGEWDDTGNPVDTEPNDTHGHGTHVSGTISGGAESGEHIGVAPDVTLLHGKVLDGGQLWAQVIAGIQWAVDRGADVVSMSLGKPEYQGSVVDPVRNAQSAGTNVVVATGNEGDGTSRSPGNVYDVTSVGAVDSSENVADFSSGEQITTTDAWTDPPADWPDSYVIPDVTAPGVAVKSATPGGGYTEKPGTSMACPHVAGVLALMKSASGGDASVSDLRSALFETTRKPDGDSSQRDTRYGLGIADALAATDLVAVESGVEGTVTDTDGTPIGGVEIETDVFSTTTDSQGSYSIPAPTGDVTVTADAYGYEATSHTVTVSEGSYTSRDFSLAPQLEARVTGSPPDVVEGGDSLTLSFEVAHADSVTVSPSGDYDPADASLSVNGSTASFDQAVTLGGGIAQVTMTVSTAAETSGTLSLEHTFQGAGDSLTVATGPTTILEALIDVGVLDAADQYGGAVLSALSDDLPAPYDVTEAPADSVLTDLSDYDAIVVQNFPDDDQFVPDFVTATTDADVGTVYLDQWSVQSDAIERLASDTGVVGAVDEAYDGTDPEFYLTDTHPLFDGVGEAGDTVPVHTESGWGDRVTFSGFDGQALADVGTGSPEGTAIAVDAGTRTVLLASLGRTQYTTDYFTPAADTILANAVVYASPDPTGEVLVPGWYADTAADAQHAAPAVDDTHVFVGGLGEDVRALSRTDGSQTWSSQRAGALADSSPLVHDGTVYVGSGGGAVYALATADGTVEWSRTVGSAVCSSPATDGTAVYAGTNDGRVLAFDAAGGTQQWSVSVGAPIYSTLAVAAGTVYLTTADGRLVALDAADGSTEWDYDTGVDLGAGSPAVANGTVYLAADRVYALDSDDGGTVWDVGYGRTDGSTPTVANGTVYVGDAAGTVHALNAADGGAAWTHATGGSIAAAPAVSDGRVIVGSTDGFLYAIDAGTGDRLERTMLGGPTRSSPALVDGEVYLGTEYGTVEALTLPDSSTN